MRLSKWKINETAANDGDWIGDLDGFEGPAPPLADRGGRGTVRDGGHGHGGTARGCDGARAAVV